MSSLAAAKASIRRQGPCACCGGKYAAHRQIDAEMGRVAVGESIEDVVADYGHANVAAMVTRWLALLELLAEHAPAAPKVPTRSVVAKADPIVDARAAGTRTHPL